MDEMNVEPVTTPNEDINLGESGQENPDDSPKEDENNKDSDRTPILLREDVVVTIGVNAIAATIFLASTERDTSIDP
jgi:hypothetical protein